MSCHCACHQKTAYNIFFLKWICSMTIPMVACTICSFLQCEHWGFIYKLKVTYGLFVHSYHECTVSSGQKLQSPIDADHPPVSKYKYATWCIPGSATVVTYSVINAAFPPCKYWNTHHFSIMQILEYTLHFSITVVILTVLSWLVQFYSVLTSWQCVHCGVLQWMWLELLLWASGSISLILKRHLCTLFFFMNSFQFTIK